MGKKFFVEHGGHRFTVEFDDSPSARAETGRARWNVTLGFTAITTLPAEQNETERRAHARLVEWLEEHPELHPTASDYLGGG
jgi:hypothetical protein